MSPGVPHITGRHGEQGRPYSTQRDVTDSAADTLVCRQTDLLVVPLALSTNGLYDFFVRGDGGTRSMPTSAAGNPCDIPLKRSPDHHQAKGHLIFRDGQYCLKAPLRNIDTTLPLCP